MAKRGRIAALLLLLVTIGLLVTGCVEPTRLQFRSQIGQKQTMLATFRLATTHPTRVHVGQDVTEFAWIFTVELEPLAIASDGSVTIKVGIRRAREEFFMGSQRDIRHHFDTAEGAFGPENVALLGESFTIVVSAQGTLVKLDTDAFCAAIAQSCGKHGAWAGRIWAQTDQLRTLLTNLLPLLAARAVRPGAHWSGPVMLRLEGPMELAGTYTFKGRKGGACVLQANARRSMNDQPVGPPLAAGAPPVKLAGTYQATMKVDPATGSLLSKEAVMELEGTASMPDARTRTFGDPVPITSRVTVTVVAAPVPTIQTITAAPNPAPIGAAVTVGATFSDPTSGDTHTATWDWGDGTSSTGTVVGEPSGRSNGSISGSHIYTAVGIYTLKLTVTDKSGGADTAEYSFIVIYDPTVDLLTGRGWIDSPVGAYKDELSLAGQATFGFVSRYPKGAIAPAGDP